MRLFPQKDNTGLYYIQGVVYSNYHHNIQKPIPFLINPSSPNTSISYKDALYLKMDFSQLDNGTPIDVGGKTIPTKNIPDCGIGFLLSNKQAGIVEYFNQIAVQYPTITKVKDEQRFSGIPSILGNDFLSRYRLILQDSHMILEK